jgi:hypothetical protein
MKKEYVVTSKKHVDAVLLHKEILKRTKEIEVANPRPLSKRSTHYFLTEEQAKDLRKNEKILSVEPKVEKKPFHCAIQESNFSKTSLSSGDFVNWGLRRCIDETNQYLGSSIQGGYRYTLTGEGVDIVISDTGIQPDHPEFQDENGNSRVQQIDWYEEAGVSGSQPVDYYTDQDGRGTGVAAIAAGKTYGWAKKAKIYSKKMSFSSGDGGDDISEHFDLIRAWHNNKPTDPVTGYKRPTVVNISWAYADFPWSSATESIIGGNYRGTDWTDTVKQPQFGMTGGFHGRRFSSIDVDIEEMINAGIHVVRAAPNNSMKADVEGGVDYDNYYTVYDSEQETNADVYYHRGASPMTENCIIVGGIDTELNGTDEQIYAGSDRGPGIDQYSPARNIFSAISNSSNRTGKFPYPFESESSYQSRRWTGNSFAAPQATGILGFYLELNRNGYTDRAKNWLNSVAADNQLYDTANNDDYSDNRSLLGGNNRFTYNPFNSVYRITIQTG